MDNHIRDGRRKNSLCGFNPYQSEANKHRKTFLTTKVTPKDYMEDLSAQINLN